MRDAMSALDQVIAFSGATVHDEDVVTLLGLVEPKVLSQTIRALAGNDAAALLKIVADLVEVGQDLNNFCRRLSGQFRNLMVLKAALRILHFGHSGKHSARLAGAGRSFFQGRPPSAFRCIPEDRNRHEICDPGAFQLENGID